MSFSLLHNKEIESKVSDVNCLPSLLEAAKAAILDEAKSKMLSDLKESSGSTTEKKRSICMTMWHSLTHPSKERFAISC